MCDDITKTAHVPQEKAERPAAVVSVEQLRKRAEAAEREYTKALCTEFDRRMAVLLHTKITVYEAKNKENAG